MPKRLLPSIICALSLSFAVPANALDIAIVVWRGETEAEKGFVDGLKELGYNVNVDVYNAEQQKSNLINIVRGDLSENLHRYDYIYTFGTTVAKVIKTSLSGKMPHIFNIVSYPASSGILPTEQGGQPNTAGVSSRVLTEEQIASAAKLLKLEKVAFAFNPREQNSTMQLEKFIKLGEKYKFTVFPIRVRPDENYYMADIGKIGEIESLSAVYFPSDSFLISNSQDILSYINKMKIPSICAVGTYIDNGCLIGTVANYTKLGKLAASILHDHMNGVPLESMPVKFDHEPTPVINKKTSILLDMHTLTVSSSD